MSPLVTVPTAKPKGARAILFKWARSEYGGVVPGIFQILAVDMMVAALAGGLYKYLHLRRSSPLTRLQREMLATVVNGKVGGAP